METKREDAAGHSFGARRTETVKRYFDFFENHLGSKAKKDRKKLETAVLNLEIMPSMRALMTAGPALTRDNVAGYNCAYLAVNHKSAFDECLFILMCGTGVGFSVERREVEKLPLVADEMYDTDTLKFQCRRRHMSLA